MKHTKIFFTLLVLAAALLAFGCTSAAIKSHAMTAEQLRVYNTAITDLKTLADNGDIKPGAVTKKLEEKKKDFSEKKFVVVDKTPGAGIKKGTTEAQLKERFQAYSLI